MKSFAIVAAVVAAVAAEADPAYLAHGYSGLAGYGYSGLGLRYAGAYAAPALAYAAPVYGKSAPCVNAANVPVPCASGHIWKREAEAEAEADPAYLTYGYNGLAGLGYSGYAGLRYAAPALAYAAPVYGKSAPCVNAANVPVPCASGHIWKREAEAEADPAYLNYGYNGLAGLGYAGYAGLGYNGYAGAYSAYAAPHAVAATPFGLTHSSNVGVCTNVSGVQVPC